MSDPIEVALDALEQQGASPWDVVTCSLVAMAKRYAPVGTVWRLNTSIWSALNPLEPGPVELTEILEDGAVWLTNHNTNVGERRQLKTLLQKWLMVEYPDCSQNADGDCVAHDGGDPNCLRTKVQTESGEYRNSGDGE